MGFNFVLNNREIQEPFYSFEEDKQEDMPEKCWIIPVSYITKSESRSKDIKMRDWLTCKGPLVLKVDIPRDDWILFDMNFIGKVSAICNTTSQRVEFMEGFSDEKTNS